KAERLASADPRLSVEERWPSWGKYRSAVINAMDNLVKDRLLLCEDVPAMQARLLQAGIDAGVPAPRGNEDAHDGPPHCR
ncbi:MAG TPA: hypothetical protein VFJ62_21740, partial [Usitatibacter sp.]|nr:hypothetical protein [Usitatibacter sp.]